MIIIDDTSKIFCCKFIFLLCMNAEISKEESAVRLPPDVFSVLYTCRTRQFTQSKGGLNTQAM